METTLEQECKQHDFHVVHKGVRYCGIMMSSKVNCPYQSREKDSNSCLPCTNTDYRFRYNPNLLVEDGNE